MIDDGQIQRSVLSIANLKNQSKKLCKSHKSFSLKCLFQFPSIKMTEKIIFLWWDLKFAWFGKGLRAWPQWDTILKITIIFWYDLI